jgi:hypothetical protein
VLRNGVVERFAVHLPLSSDHAQIGAGGTRHAAALGLSERCDALCVVVSEERGTVSVAHAGELRVLGGADELLAVLRDFRPAPGAAGITRWRSPRPWIEAAMALGIAVLLWWAVIVGSTEVTRTVAAPVRIENLPRDLVLDAVEPSTLEVTLSGNRRDLLLGTATPVEVRVDAFLAKLGRRTFEIEARQVERPPGTEVLGIEPARIRIEVSTATPVAGQQ